MMFKFLLPFFFVVLLMGCSFANRDENNVTENNTEFSDGSGAALFLALLDDRSVFSSQEETLAAIENTWEAGYSAMAIESLRFTSGSGLGHGITDLLTEKTGQSFGTDINAWYDWLWNTDEQKHPDYAHFKAELYKNIDPRFEKYFVGRGEQARIRLDEIQWGGVEQDGIPPLRSPKMISAQNATYLDDGDVVFGIEVNGDVRAYPKRILAWHEMFVDTVGGVDVAGVYCTLCGTVVLYDTTYNGVQYELGTSGFLYRSNKLMYDRATQSLWNTLTGEPVVGPLIDQGIALSQRSVVTTTWGEWKRRHPQTKVLSLDTGFNRDYGEGVAYNAYFATDELMFRTPFDDTRLANKQEVLALRFPAHPKKQLAIDTDFLTQHTVYHDAIGDQKIVVLTDTTGANRVYNPAEHTFVAYDGDATVTDDQGNQWTLTESALTFAQERVERLPYHRAFWFGWHAAYPDTRLVQ